MAKYVAKILEKDLETTCRPNMVMPTRMLNQGRERAVSRSNSVDAPSSSASVSKVTFIPIVFTINAQHNDTAKVDQQLLQSIKPLVPVQQ